MTAINLLPLNQSSMKRWRNRILVGFLASVAIFFCIVASDFGVAHVSQRIVVFQPRVGILLLRLGAWLGSDLAHRSLWGLAKEIDDGDATLSALGGNAHDYLIAHGSYHLESMARTGDVAAKAELAFLNMTKSKWVKNPSIEKAFEYWIDAAEHGESMAAIYLGFGVCDGLVREPMRTKVLRLLKIEAESQSYYAKDAQKLLVAIKNRMALGELVDSGQLASVLPSARSWLQFVQGRTSSPSFP